MANKRQKAIRRQDREAKINKDLDAAATRHGSRGGKSFLPPDRAFDNMRPRSWKRTKRHPANIAIGKR